MSMHDATFKVLHMDIEKRADLHVLVTHTHRIIYRKRKPSPTFMHPGEPVLEHRELVDLSELLEQRLEVFLLQVSRDLTDEELDGVVIFHGNRAVESVHSSGAVRGAEAILRRYRGHLSPSGALCLRLSTIHSSSSLFLSLPLPLSLLYAPLLVFFFLRLLSSGFFHFLHLSLSTRVSCYSDSWRQIAPFEETRGSLHNKSGPANHRAVWVKVLVGGGATRQTFVRRLKVCISKHGAIFIKVTCLWSCI